MLAHVSQVAKMAFYYVVLLNVDLCRNWWRDTLPMFNVEFPGIIRFRVTSYPIHHGL